MSSPGCGGSRWKRCQKPRHLSSRTSRPNPNKENIEKSQFEEEEKSNNPEKQEEFKIQTENKEPQKKVKKCLIHPNGRENNKKDIQKENEQN